MKNSSKKKKTFKTIVKALLISLGIVFLVSALATVVIQQSGVQTYVVNRLTLQLSERLNTSIRIDKVDFRFFNKFLVYGVLVNDQQGDTLLYSKEVDARLLFFKPNKQKIYFHKIQLKDLRYYSKKLGEEKFNHQFIVEALSKNDTLKKNWKIDCSNLKLVNATLRYETYDKLPQDEGINFRNAELFRMNAEIGKLNFKNGITTLKIEQFQATEKSGFEIKNLRTSLTITKNSLDFTNLQILTTDSDLKAARLIFDYEHITDFKRFSYKVRFISNFRKSTLHINDLFYFTQKVKGISRSLTFSGNFTGIFNNIKGKNLYLKYAGNTAFRGNISINGLPDVQESFFFIDAESLLTNKSDIETIPLPPFDSAKNLTLPIPFQEFGFMNYTGKLTGFLSEFVVYGRMESALGKLSTDIKIKREKTDSITIISGEVRSSDFDLGTFLNAENKIGKLAGRGSIEGFIKADKEMELTVESKIKSFQANDYVYRNIDVSGLIFRNRFDGIVTINDPNLNFDFFGHINFADSIPVFDFTADITKAHLDKLKVDTLNRNSNLSLSLAAKFTGNSIDNVNGRVDVYNTSYYNQRDSIKMKKFSVHTKEQENEKELNIESDFFDAKLFGKYHFIALLDIIKNIDNILLPAVANEPVYRNDEYVNNFNFKINLIDIEPLTKTLYPDLYVSPGTILGGFYSSIERAVEVVGHSDSLIYRNNKLQDLEFKSQIVNEEFSLNFDCISFYLTQTNYIDNFHFESTIYDDTIQFSSKWNNYDSLLYKGHINANCYFTREDSLENLVTRITLKPSEIVLADSVWKINKAHVSIDSTSVKIKDFFAFHKDQHLKLNGTISKNKNDTIYASYQNIDLSLFNLFTREKGFKFNGILNGISNLTSFYSDRLFTSELSVTDFMLNDEKLGNMTIDSYWDKPSEKLLIQSIAKRDDINTFSLIGAYIPRDKNMDFEVTLNKLRLNILQPYFTAVTNDLRGIASGDLKLTGKIKEPVLEGELKVQKASFTIDYLQTRYNFTDFVSLRKNKIEFDDLTLYDARGNIALLNGSIDHQYFRQYNFNMNIDAKEYLLLDTREADNNLYFGTAYGTGLISITGTPENVFMNIAVKTDKNTVFYIPLSSSEVAEQTDFITFVSDEFEPIEEREEYQVNLSGLQLNFDLEVTPDAEVQLIYDSKVGDVLKGRGNAELNMNITTLGEFSIYGDYEIDQGEYLFTLQNVINKKFAIEKGGTISWNGDPYNADLDMKAIYSIKKVSIMDLIPDSTYRNLRYPIDCQLLMTGNLLNPDIEFDIAIPPPTDSRKDYIRSIIAGFPEDELNKQLISLLVLNRFQPYFNLNPSAGTTPVADINDAYRSATELLSNQLSLWLSQISDDVDLGFTYQPGDELNPQQYEIALSTQLLNDRLTIDTNLGIGGQPGQEEAPNQNNNNIVSDFILGVKLNKSGKLRMAVYNKANKDYYEYTTAPYTQGIGLFYQEEFNKFSDLFRRKKNK